MASHPLGSKELQEPSLTTTEALCEIVARQWGNTLSVDCNKFTWLYPAISTQAQAEVCQVRNALALLQYVELVTSNSTANDVWCTCVNCFASFGFDVSSSLLSGCRR